MKKLLTLLITLTLCISMTISMVGCGEEDSNTTTVNAYHVYEPDTKQNHRRIANNDRDGEFLLKDGKTSYTIVLPNDKKGDEFYVIAKEELLLFFKRATGVTINSTYDGFVETSEGVLNQGLQHNNENMYISIGDTSLLRSSPINGNKEKYDREILVGDGYRILTEGKTIFLLGDSSVGVLNAVYGFLELTLNYEYYGRSAYTLNTGVTNIPLYSYDVLEIPDILYRNAVNYTVAHAEGLYKTSKATDTEVAAGFTRWDYLRYHDRMKQEWSIGDFCMKMHQYFSTSTSGAGTGATQHSSSECWDPRYNNAEQAFDESKTKNLTKFDPAVFGEDFSAEKLQELMPNWIATTGGQWCYTAHGNELARQAMIYWTAMKIENSLMLYPEAKYPNLDTISLSIEDGIAQCDCAKCIEEFNLDGGSYQGIITRVCNAAMDLVVEWMERPENAAYRRDNLKLIYFAYSACVPTPTEEINGRLEMINPETCKMNDNVGVWFCGAGGQADYNTTYYSENPRSGSTVGNENFTKMLDYFSREAACVWFYNYTGNYHDTTHYSNDWASWYNHHNYQMLVYAGVQNQFHTHNFAMEIDITWGALAQYLNAKLSWDCTTWTTEELTNNFFNVWFGPAAETMKQAFHMVRVHSQIVARHQVKEFADKNTAVTWWTYNGFWKPYYDIMDQASQEVLAYPDKAMAQIYLERVEGEMISPLYQILKRFGKIDSAPFSLEQKQTYVSRIGNILSRYGKIAMDGTGGSTNIITWFEKELE